MTKKTKEPDYKKVAEALLKYYWWERPTEPVTVYCKYCGITGLKLKDLAHPDWCPVDIAKAIVEKNS